jgi:hypothetical protein
VRDLAPWERERNAKILAALEAQRKEFEADPAKARAYFMSLGYWNEDGSLKDEYA